MRGDPPLQAVQPAVEPEDRQVRGGQVDDPRQDALADLGALIGGGQRQPRVQALLDGSLTAGPAEDEADAGQQAVCAAAPGRCPDVGHRATSGGGARPAGGAPEGRAIALGRISVDPELAAGLVDALVVAGQPDQLGVDRPARLVDEQVVQRAVGEDVLPERDRPVLLDHDVGVAADLRQPGTELLGVAHRRRQGDHRHMLGQVDDHLLPHRSALSVGEVVHLIHHDELQTGQRAGSGVEHVAQHLGRHDHHRCLAVDAVVPGEQSYALHAVAGDQVVVLLVAQSLDRSRVEALGGSLDRQMHRELADHGLAGARRRRDQHPAAGQDAVARAHLEVVQTERVGSGEPLEDGRGHGATLPGQQHPHAVRHRTHRDGKRADVLAVGEGHQAVRGELHLADLPMQDGRMRSGALPE